MAYEGDLLTPEESDNRLGWVEFTVLRDWWSTPQTESAGKATFENADRVQRYWEVRIDEVHQDWESEVPDTLTLQFSVGSGWYITDEGNVRHEEDTDPDKPVKFKNSSVFGQVLALITGQRRNYVAESVTALDGGPDEIEYDMTGAKKALLAAEHGDPREPGIFVGHKYLARGLGLKYRSRPGEQDRQLRSKMLPVAFLGMDGDVESSSPSEMPTNQIGAEDVKGFFEDTDTEVDIDLSADLAKMLNTSASEASFKRNALALAGDNDGLRQAVMRGDLWKLRGA